ncbi:hypothetical protein [Streptomyces sp. KLOTTS4A1]|uniref:hypothetical protein n=1 Tax=Streptomyces sp. KLOTTS4A1 TaxID=3390996 RepID=UPI0039F571B0
MADRHASTLMAFCDEHGEVRPGAYPAYDEAQYDNASEAAEFLDALMSHLQEALS